MNILLAEALKALSSSQQRLQLKSAIFAAGRWLIHTVYVCLWR